MEQERWNGKSQERGKTNILGYFYRQLEFGLAGEFIKKYIHASKNCLCEDEVGMNLFTCSRNS